MDQVRLIAYRGATTSSTTETGYELDLQEHPVISLNYQFSDIKEPQTRKASFSQTFKLPFTDNNNLFFQNWFDVNMSTLVFSTRKKFNATLFVGSMPQFEGYIQLKSVYQKAELYEVVLMSNTADLFSAIGENTLKDVFRNDDDSYSDELNHLYTQANIIASWNGSSSSFVNTQDPAVSLRDTDANVQKVMYPMSVTKPNFFYDPDETVYLNMSSSSVTSLGTLTAQDYMVPITQLRPALQIKNLISSILSKAGFSYTSAFIDGAYFGKLFMTIGNHLAEAGLPLTDSTAQPGGVMRVGNNGTWGVYEPGTGGMPSVGDTIPEGAFLNNYVPADTVSGSDCIVDAEDLWNEAGSYFEKKFEGITSITVKHNLKLENVNNVGNDPIQLKVEIVDLDNPDVVYGDPAFSNIYPSGTTFDYENEIEHSLNLQPMGVGQKAKIRMSLLNAKFVGTSGDERITFGASANITCANLESKILIEWIPFNEGAYNGTINVPACIDESILQKDFLLDIIQRFNLLFISDPDNPTNLIIEPYNDYLASSTIKSWTDKLDVSKEVIVRDTTTIQKKTIDLSDLEDEDLVNKDIRDFFPDISVYGHYKRIDKTNEFAKGELKNTPIFSPYINQKVFQNENTQLSSHLKNMTVQYEYTYNGVEGGFEYPLTVTKPKLFYYNGSATTVLNDSGVATPYNMHSQAVADGSITTFSFDTYPVCTPFDITPSSNVYTLTQANKSLYWNTNPPIVGELSVFNYTDETGSWFDNTLYGLYWKKYLDGIYSPDARIMECYLYLDDVDIHNFKFNDEVFIKNAYWRVLNITNYQVGVKTSTKVTLLKVLDTATTCVDCGYVVGADSTGSNLFMGVLYYWCPEDTPGCTPSVSGSPYTGLLAPESCCECMGGLSMTFVTLATGLYPCIANAGSLPINLTSLFGIRSILSQGQAKTIIADKMRGLKKGLTIGSDNGKFSSALMPFNNDDIVVKYKTEQKGVPRLQGEMHRIILTGYTEGNTRGYAYPQGRSTTMQVFVPYNTNMIIRVSGTATVIGGTSSTYTVSYTEAFAYYTAFKNVNGTITQLGTTGGTAEFALKESGSATCTLYLTTSGGTLQFGLDDNQTDTKRIWSLSVDLAVQRLPNIAIPYGENWALFQNGSNIQFENFDFMLWN